MEAITIEVVVALCVVGALAGLIDAIAGGGGLLSVPALLWAGLPPVTALGTNKAQAVFGSFTASLHFVRHGSIDVYRLGLAIVCTFVGSAVGTLTVRQLDSSVLAPLIPLLLIGFAAYFILTPGIGAQDATCRISHPSFALSIGTAIGFYDGFFGPGTGTFFAAAFVLLLGYNLTRATAGTKVLNFTSNFASLLFFAVHGDVLWPLGVAMGTAQVGGAWVGARLAIKHGPRLIRPLLVIVSLTMSIGLLWQELGR